MSTPLAPGARVEIRDEEWIVRSTRPDASGGEAVRVTGVSELVRDREAVFLTSIDSVTPRDPEQTELVPDPSPRFAKTRLHLESLLRRTPPTDNAIHLGHLAAIDPVDYQLHAAAKALTLPRARYLLADGVGLGKTIEVGILLTELMRRGIGRRILVVAMKSILAQFQQELWSRFTIPLVRLDSVGIQRVQAKIPSSSNPFHHYDRVIVSIDTLKNDVKYRQHLENCRWDVVVIDECQNVAQRTRGSRGRIAMRAELAKLLARQTDALILTSATPHDGSPRSFASLMRLLEPTAIANEEDFTSEEVAEYFQRKFKKDVAHQLNAAFPERAMHPRRIDASQAEDAVFDALAGAEFRAMRRGKGGVLFRTTLLKAFLSSPAAFLATVDARLDRQARRQDDEAADVDGDALEADRQTLSALRTLAERIAPEDHPKTIALLELIREILAVGERVVVFSERIDTLEWLALHLSRACKLKHRPGDAKSQIATFHGSLEDTTQMDIVQSFGSADSPIRVLLASDAAAEGINLHHHCHQLIHFDLPWSLITLVQRNGRIDRYGQTLTPHIHTLFTVPADEDLRGDLRVLERLVEKEEQVQKNLGDAAWLMNLHDPELEEQAVAAAVQGDAQPTQVLPDEPAEDDTAWFDEIFGDDLAAAREPPLEVRRERVSLFADDLAFAREAFREAVPDDDAVRWFDDIDGFEIMPPDDLQRRYAFLPPELTRQRDRWRLTTDRARVQQALDVARETDGAWPEWELFWPQHPVCEWLDDRVLSALGRHAAWVVPVAGDLGGDDALFLFQGMFSNQRSQPVIVDWFGVPIRAGAVGEVVDLDQALERSGLRVGASNTASTDVPATLSGHRAEAVAAAREHMARLRAERASSLSQMLTESVRKLSAWKRETQRLASKRGDPRAADEAEKIYDERKQWIDQTLRTVAEPYLRLAAVFTRADRT